MKTILLFLLTAVACFGQGKRISQYPNTNYMRPGDYFITEGEDGKTNLNVKYADLAAQINGTASNQFRLYVQTNEAPRIAGRLTLQGDVIRPLGSDLKSVGEAAIHYDAASDLWHAYYESGRHLILHGLSTNGINWTLNSNWVAIGQGTGGEALNAGRTCVFVESNIVYLSYSDVSNNPGGNIWIATNTPGSWSNFTRATMILADDAGKVWANRRMAKFNGTYYMIQEGSGTAGSSWRTMLFTAPAVMGPWTAQNGSNFLDSTMWTPGILPTNPNESSSGGSPFFVDGWYHIFTWGHNTPLYLNDNSKIFYQRSPDLIHWTPPTLIMNNTNQLLDGHAMTQVADCWTMEAKGRTWIYYSKTQIIAPADAGSVTALATYDGPFAQLVAEPREAETLAGVEIMPTVIADRHVPQYEETNRQVRFVSPWDAVMFLAPTGTVAVAGVLNPDLTGTYTYSAPSGIFAKLGAATLINVGTNTWEIWDATLTPKWRGTGASHVDPSGTYSVNLNGSTGTATVTYTPPNFTNFGFFIGGGPPNFRAPRGSIFVQTNTGANLPECALWWRDRADTSPEWSSLWGLTNGDIWLNGHLFATSYIRANNYQAEQDGGFYEVNRYQMMGPTDGMISFRDTAGTSFIGMVMGTNSATAIHVPMLKRIGAGFGISSPNGASSSNHLHVAGSAFNTNGTYTGYGGGINPVGAYGSLMMNATNIVVCAGAAGVYTNISGTNFTTMVTNGFYGATAGVSAALTNLVAGWYRVQIAASYMGANAGSYESEVFTNQVACDLISFKDTFDTPARLRNGSSVGIIYLPAGTRVSFKIQDGGSGSSIAVHRASLTVGTP